MSTDGERLLGGMQHGVAAALLRGSSGTGHGGQRCDVLGMDGIGQGVERDGGSGFAGIHCAVGVGVAALLTDGDAERIARAVYGNGDRDVYAIAAQLYAKVYGAVGGHLGRWRVAPGVGLVARETDAAQQDYSKQGVEVVISFHTICFFNAANVVINGEITK